MSDPTARHSTSEQFRTAATGGQSRVSARWSVLFGLAWTGVWMAQLAPFQYLLPVQLTAALGEPVSADGTGWQASVVDFGVVSGLAAVCMAIGLPLAGALSDRTSGRFGRRRPWIAIGTLVFACALVGLGFQTSTTGIAVWWCAAMFGFCAVASALTALIKDRVPHEQRGTVAGAMSMAQAFGLIVGLGSVAVLALTADSAYILLAAFLCACAAPFFLSAGTEPAAVSRSTTAAHLSLSPLALLRLHDFRWALIGRITVNFGNSLCTCLLIYFLQYDLKIADPGSALLLLTVAYIASVLAVSMVCGWLSDRVGRRKPFIVGSAALQSVAAVLLMVSDSLWSTVVALAIIGAGYGCYMGIDQALGADVLPDAENSGKELGVMNVALIVPPAICPLLGAGLVDLFDGSFVELFATSGILTFIGGLAVLRIRSVR
ncbi:MFS transporter [Rhodococcus sovatensis]|uniref:MFS transporter n=1 Tax=Rhodococcus sovatensis TaxID=1805840 RepID=A0ABZ2PI59_9NOCA